MVGVLPAAAAAAPEGIPETIGVQVIGPTSAEVLGAVQLPAGTSYQAFAESGLADEPWCTSHSGSPSKSGFGPPRRSSGGRETFSVRLEGLLPGHEYCAAAAVTVPEFGAASGQQKAFATRPEPFPPARWFFNGKLDELKHEPVFSFGKIELHNAQIKTISCGNFAASQRGTKSRKGPNEASMKPPATARGNAKPRSHVR
jgi:hypothetical protein